MQPPGPGGRTGTQSDVAAPGNEFGDDSVEEGVFEAGAILAGPEGSEGLKGLGHNIRAQLSDDLGRHSFENTPHWHTCKWVTPCVRDASSMLSLGL